LVTDLNSKKSEIAIIGISGAFSGGKDLYKYWEQISYGESGLKLHSIDEYRIYGMVWYE
jgi:acyl transferase domain-containing protein